MTFRPAARGFAGLPFAPKEAPPDGSSVFHDHGVPCRLFELDFPPLGAGDSTVASRPDIELLPLPAVEGFAHVVPPTPDAFMAAEGLSFGLP
jgi:hypothetical protein